MDEMRPDLSSEPAGARGRNSARARRWAMDSGQLRDRVGDAIDDRHYRLIEAGREARGREHRRSRSARANMTPCERMWGLRW